MNSGGLAPESRPLTILPCYEAKDGDWELDYITVELLHDLDMGSFF